MRKYNFHDDKSVATPFDSSGHLFLVNNDDEIFNQWIMLVSLVV